MPLVESDHRPAVGRDTVAHHRRARGGAQDDLRCEFLHHGVVRIERVAGGERVLARATAEEEHHAVRHAQAGLLLEKQRVHQHLLDGLAVVQNGVHRVHVHLHERLVFRNY